MYMNRKTIVAVVALLLIGCFESQAAQTLNLQQCIEMARQHNRSLQNAFGGAEERGSFEISAGNLR